MSSGIQSDMAKHNVSRNLVASAMTHSGGIHSNLVLSGGMQPEMMVNLTLPSVETNMAVDTAVNSNDGITSDIPPEVLQPTVSQS